MPVAYQIFDLLAFDGLDATPLPYVERRRLLADVVVPGPSWSVPRHHVGGGQALLDSVDDLGIEGVWPSGSTAPTSPAGARGPG